MSDTIGLLYEQVVGGVHAVHDRHGAFLGNVYLCLDSRWTAQPLGESKLLRYFSCREDAGAALLPYKSAADVLSAERTISLALQAEIDRLASENALLNETVRTYTTMLLESRSERDIAVTDLQASRQAYRELEAALDEHTVTLYGIFGDKRSLRALVDDAMKERPEIVTRVGGEA